MWVLVQASSAHMIWKKRRAGVAESPAERAFFRLIKYKVDCKEASPGRERELRWTARNKGGKCFIAHGSINHALGVRGCC